METTRKMKSKKTLMESLDEIAEHSKNEELKNSIAEKKKALSNSNQVIEK